MPTFNRFVMNEKGKATIDDVNKWFADLHAALAEIVPEGRQMALATTKLEEAKMWAVNGIAHDVSNQQSEQEAA